MITQMLVPLLAFVFQFDLISLLSFMQDNIFDVMSPMKFRLNYSIVNRLENDHQIHNNLKPILDATTPPTVTKEVCYFFKKIFLLPLL